MNKQIITKESRMRKATMEHEIEAHEADVFEERRMRKAVAELTLPAGMPTATLAVHHRVIGREWCKTDQHTESGGNQYSEYVSVETNQGALLLCSVSQNMSTGERCYEPLLFSDINYVKLC